MPTIHYSCVHVVIGPCCADCCRVTCKGKHDHCRTLTSPLHPFALLRYFSVSAQRGKQLGPIDVLKGFMFDSAAMDEQLQVRAAGEGLCSTRAEVPTRRACNTAGLHLSIY